MIDGGLGDVGGANAGGSNHPLAGWNNPTHSLGGGLAQVEDVDLTQMFSDWM
jgi:hypothetical protein